MHDSKASEPKTALLNWQLQLRVPSPFPDPATASCLYNLGSVDGEPSHYPEVIVAPPLPRVILAVVKHHDPWEWGDLNAGLWKVKLLGKFRKQGFVAVTVALFGGNVSLGGNFALSKRIFINFDCIHSFSVPAKTRAKCPFHQHSTSSGFYCEVHSHEDKTSLK